MSSPPASSQPDRYAPPALAAVAAVEPFAPCRNCDAAMHGPYCAECGQHVVHADPTFHDVVHDATHEFLHVDGKIVETLRMLFTRPGALTVEHRRGRRARYIPPIRLYLTCSLLYFLIGAVADPVEKAVKRDGGQYFKVSGTPTPVTEAERAGGDSVARVLEAQGRTRGPVGRLFFEQAARVQRDRLGFARNMRATIPKIFFAFVPVFAWIVGIVYRRRAHYPAHLYFALHTFSFGFLTAAVAEVAGLLPGASFVAGWVLMAVWAWYGVRALRTVYGGSLRSTLSRALGIAALGFTAFVLVGTLGGAIVYFTF